MFNLYPYLNVNDLNLDYLLMHMKNLENIVKNFVALNVVKYANPIQWSISTQYEQNTVVVDPITGTAYLSVQPVPLGIALTNTDYWTPIFNLNLLSANQNITFRDDGANVLATFESNVDDWLIWNNLLYKVSQHININEAYVEGYNIDRYTVELFIKDYITAVLTVIGDLNDLTTTDKDSIVDAINELVTAIGNINDLTTADKDCIVDAINELVTTIGDLNDLTTTDKDCIVDAINELVMAIGNINTNIGNLNDLNTSDKSSVVNAINETLSSAGKNVYTPSDVYGLDSTGATDCASVLASLTDNIGFKAGTYLIATSCTINAQIVLPKGAILNIASGVTVTFNNTILAGAYQIFSGAGTVTGAHIDNAFAEWFGAKNDNSTDCTSAIQKCINAFNTCHLQTGTYYCSGTIYLSATYQKLIGTNVGEYTNADTNKCTNIRSGATLAIKVGKDTYSTPDANIQGNEIRNLTIKLGEDNVDRIGIALKYTIFTLIDHVTVLNGSHGFDLQGVVHSWFYNCTASRDTSSATLSGLTEYTGFRLYNSALDLVGDNASVYFDKCTAAGAISNAQTVNSYGFAVRGRISDLFFTGCETAGFTTGFELIPTTTTLTSNSDVHLTNCIADGAAFSAFHTHAVISGGGKANCMIEFVGCWGAVNAGSGGIPFRTNDCNGVSYSNCVINANSNTIGFYCSGASRIQVDNMLVSNATYGISFDSCSRVKASGSCYSCHTALYTSSGTYMVFNSLSEGCTQFNLNGTVITTSGTTDQLVGSVKLCAPYSL